MTGTSKPVEGHARAHPTGVIFLGYLVARCECGEETLLVREGDLPECRREHKAAVLAARDNDETKE